MHDVVVYLSSLPRIADRNRKVETLQAFAQGARAQGANVLVQTDYRVVPAKLAVILGWVGTKINGQHIQLRQSAIDFQRQSGNKIMSIDGSCFKFADPTSIFLRYSIDGVYYNTDNYANDNSSLDKWTRIQQRLNLNMRPWRTVGDHILVCGQRDGGWSMKGVDMPTWTVQTVKQLRQYTNRKIVVRPHPRFPMNVQLFRSVPNVVVSAGTTLEQDLKNAWASVFFNSSSCVASILAGVPVFATDTDCVAWSIANTDMSLIETPTLADRAQWLYNLSAAHWTDEESKAGLIYQKFLPFLPT